MSIMRRRPKDKGCQTPLVNLMQASAMMQKMALASNSHIPSPVQLTISWYQLPWTLRDRKEPSMDDRVEENRPLSVRMTYPP